MGLACERKEEGEGEREGETMKKTRSNALHANIFFLCFIALSTSHTLFIYVDMTVAILSFY